MRLTIEGRGPSVTVDGVPCGVWNGRTDNGAACLVFVWAFAIPADVADPLELGRMVGAGSLVMESGAEVETEVGECRAWWVKLPGGAPACVYVRRIAVPDGEASAEFDAGLSARPRPADWDEALAIIHPQGVAPIDPSYN